MSPQILRPRSLLQVAGIAAAGLAASASIVLARDGFTMEVMYGQQCLRESLNEGLCKCILAEAKARFPNLIEREVFLDMVIGGVHPASNQLRPKLDEKAFMTRLPAADKSITVCKQRNP